MKIEEVLKELEAGIYQPKYKFSKDFEDLFTPVVFTANDGRRFYKLDDQKVVINTNDYNKQIEEVAKLCKFGPGTPNRIIYKEDSYKEGTYCHYEILENNDFKRYILYINHKYIVQFNNFKLELEKNTNEIKVLKDIKTVGRDAMTEINNRLRNSGILKEDETLQEHLVGVAKKYQYVLKLCIPNQIGYIKNSKTEQIIDHCYKADVSSAFPSQLQKPIPTLKKCVINKIKEPTEEYKFVFSYKKNSKYGRLQIYNELDTDIDFENKFMADVKFQTIKSQSREEALKKVDFEEEEIYIACKEADITLADVMQDLYNEKLNGTTEAEINKAKMIMNAFIGYCQLNNRPGLAFISAVVIARQNHAMLERCRYLEETGNQVLYIATDSIVWRGIKSDISTDDKYLGSFTNEYENCRFYGIQVGSYQIEKDGKVKTYCSYLDNDENKKNLKFGQLPRPKNGVKLWQK